MSHDPQPTPTASQRLASFLVNLDDTSVPPGILHRAKLHVLDTLGAGIAGASSLEVARSRVAFDVGAGEASAGDVGVNGRVDASASGTPIWGTPARTTPLTAAFINGVASHAFELDDCHGCDHSGAVVVPAAFAAAERAGVPTSGAVFLRAIVGGYEVARRVQTALGGYDEVNNRGWHSTGICGVFGAAAAAGIILGLTEEQMVSALGLSGSYAGGTWAFMSDGAMAKRMHVGRAAEMGLNSVLLARAGFTGPADLFSAEWGGFLSLYGGPSRDERELYSTLGSEWQIDVTAIKPYASCRGTHSAVDAVLSLNADQPIDVDTITGITVRTSELLYNMCGTRDTTSLVTTQLSMPFAIASALLHGGVRLEHISALNRSTPALAQLMELVTMEIDENQHGGSAAPTLAIQTSAAVFELQAGEPRGSQGNRLSDTDTISKFTSLATTRLSTAAAAELSAAVLALETCVDTRALAELMVTTTEPDLVR